MAGTFANKVASYLDSLTATNSICVELGTTLMNASNLFNSFEPDRPFTVISIHNFGGGPPNRDRQRQNPAIQIRVRATTRQKALRTQQSIINELHMNTLRGEGKMFCVNSAPLLIGTDKEKFHITTSNYEVKHVKI